MTVWDWLYWIPLALLVASVCIGGFCLGIGMILDAYFDWDWIVVFAGVVIVLLSLTTGMFCIRSAVMAWPF